MRLCVWSLFDPLFELFICLPILYFILLIFHFILYVDRFGAKSPVRFREWGVWPFGQQRPSHTGVEGWINILPWYSLAGVAMPPVRRKGARAGLPIRVSVRHVVRKTDRLHLSLPSSQSCFGGSKGLRQGNSQGWWKRSTFRWYGRQLTLDQTVGSRVWWHTQGSSGRPASDLGWGSSSKTAPGSLSTGSPPGRTLPHKDGSMHSQANGRAGKVLRLPIRALPSVIVDTEKVLREADGPVEMWLHRESASGGKVVAPGCASKAGRVSLWRARRSQADAVSADTQVNMEDAPKLLKIPQSECPDILIRLPRHKWPESWSSMEHPVVPLERNLYGHPLAGL